MKTVTEFTSIEIKAALDIRFALLKNLQVDGSDPSQTDEPITTSETETTTVAPTEPVIKSPEERLAERLEEKRKAWEEKIGKILPNLTSRLKDRFKWSDERTQHAIHGMDIVFRKKLPDLRAVRIIKLEKETEAAPKFGKKIGEFIYIAEYYPPKQRERSPKDKNRKGDRKSKKGRKRNFRKNPNAKSPRSETPKNQS